MSGHPVALSELRRRLNEVNSEYRVLVRSNKAAGRLAKMIRLRDERLELTTRIIRAEQPATCQSSGDAFRHAP